MDRSANAHGGTGARVPAAPCPRAGALIRIGIRREIRSDPSERADTGEIVQHFVTGAGIVVPIELLGLFTFREFVRAVAVRLVL